MCFLISLFKTILCNERNYYLHLSNYNFPLSRINVFAAPLPKFLYLSNLCCKRSYSNGMVTRFKIQHCEIVILVLTPDLKHRILKWYSTYTVINFSLCGCLENPKSSSKKYLLVSLIHNFMKYEQHLNFGFLLSLEVTYFCDSFISLWNGVCLKNAQCRISHILTRAALIYMWANTIMAITSCS